MGVKGLRPGEGVGYGSRFRSDAPATIAVVPAGYADGLDLRLDYRLTHSCYDPLPDGRPCGRCDSCLLRAKGFHEAGALDPVLQP